MPYTLLLNPAARAGRAARLADRLRAWAAAAGLDAEVVSAASREALAEAAAEAARAGRRVVAVGGDGTIHTAVCGLVAAGTPVPLGLVPCGTGNDFVKMTGTPRGPEAAVRALRTAVVHAFDLGTVRWAGDDGAGERPFVNAAGFGLDAAVAAGVARYKRLPGALAYLAAVAEALRALRPTPARVVADGVPLHDGPLLLVTVANGRSSGGHFRLTPAAAADDGRLDVCLVHAAPLGRLLPLVPRVLAGRHGGSADVTLGTARTVTITAATPLPLHADGEVLAHAARTVEVVVHPGALPVLVPPGFSSS